MAKSAMDCVKLARDAKRPHLKDFIDLICSDFEELHGDRLVNDDRGLVGGFATITFVDTPGAYPGKEAEERGQAEAIAKSLEFFSRLRTPVVVVVTGEGGSGGALAIAVGDRILMMENAVYSVISPEGCAGILWRDGAKAPEAAEALKITAPDLLKLGAIDEVVKEPAGGAQKNHKAAANAVRKAVLAALKELAKVPVDELVERRYEKIRSYGNFH